MIRADVVGRILAQLGDDDIVVAADGAISREAYRFKDRPRTYFMLGSMGQVASIALGLALIRSERVVALDGDGNLLMGLGGAAMVGGFRPKNLFHVILDNQGYATTGGQPCLSSRIDLSEVARGAGYAWAETVRCEDTAGTDRTVASWLDTGGPAFLRCIVESDDPDPAPRIPMTPFEMADRFRGALDSEF